MLYDHAASRHAHSLHGAYETLKALFSSEFPRSVLDVGCGEGTWLNASVRLGAADVTGIDGVPIPADRLLFPRNQFHIADLNQPLDLQQRFELVLCLETAEHLDPHSAATIVATLARHGDRILFSAAIPGQTGFNHVNCQWPKYWQALFNENGFVCDDSVRWAIWDNGHIEPWYRQNLMLAVRDHKIAGTEPRIRSVVHPGMLENLLSVDVSEREERLIAAGSLPLHWYLSVPFKAAAGKLRRRLMRYVRPGGTRIGTDR